VTPNPTPPLTELTVLAWILAALALGAVVSFFLVGCDSSAHWMPTGLKWTYRDQPLLVQWDHAEFEEHNQSMEYAMDLFPCSMLQPAQAGETPDITVEVATDQRNCVGEYVEIDQKHLAHALPCRKQQTCEIYLDGSVLGRNITETYLLFAHELGHCIGLSHNNETGSYASIMHSTVVGFAGNLELGKLLPTFTRTEEALIKQRYCRRAPR